MENLLTASLAILLGLTGLVWGADRFVAGSAGAARNLGVPTIVVGLTIVSVGTSAPEILVATNAALKGVGELAVGNALGSNLANMGLVLGITALVAPLPTQRHLITQDTAAFAAGLCLWNNTLGRWESLALLAGLPLILWLLVRLKVRHPSPEELQQLEEIPALSTPVALLWFAIGLATLLAASELLVWGATTAARHLGVSELMIGLTVVAIGTSLPELAASVMSALRGHHAIAIGNVMGSNVFNLLAVLPIAGAIQPMMLDTRVFDRDFLALASLTGLLALTIVVVRSRRSGGRSISRTMGAGLLAFYLGYCAWLTLSG